VNPRRLYRSADDRWIAGVAAGVADYFDVDPILVRIIWLISLPSGITLLAYIIMIVAVPVVPQKWPEPSPWQPGGAPLGYNATFTPPAAPAADAGAPAADVGAAGGTPGAPQGAVPAPESGPSGDWHWQGRQDRWQRRAERWEHRGERHGSGGIVFGALLIVVGALIAWHEIDPRLDLSLAWPVAIIAFGVFLVASSVGRRKGE
jgi:phage shock protein C